MQPRSAHGADEICRSIQVRSRRLPSDSGWFGRLLRTFRSSFDGQSRVWSCYGTRQPAHTRTFGRPKQPAGEVVESRIVRSGRPLDPGTERNSLVDEAT